MKQNRSVSVGMYTMGIAVLFLVGFLLLVVLGAAAYRDVAAGQARNNDTRALLSYLSNCVKGGDRAGNISVQTAETGQILVIADGSGYALHIYQVDGQLLEEYSALDALPNPERATVLGETSEFTIEQPTENTLRISTDAGTILLALRSGGRIA